MTEYKKQHYVPQFYFRFFSTDGINVNIYNLNQRKIFRGSIKNTCCKPFFYSKNNEIEKCFRELEEKQARVLKKILQDESILTLTREEYYTFLLSFILFQLSRTATERKKAKELTNIFSEEVIKPLFLSSRRTEDLNKSKKMLDDFKITFPGDHLMNMSISLESIPLISDLVPILLVNKTESNFIFSDNPVLRHNTFFNHVKNRGTKGFYTTGLQIFCPLDDKHMLMFFDSDFYDIKLNHPNLVEIKNETDIESLNSLQYLYCDENIFFSSDKNTKYIEILHNKLSGLNKKERIENEKMIFQIDEKSHAEILHTFTGNINYSLKLSFLELKKTKRKLGVRNPELLEIHRELTDKQFKNNSKTIQKYPNNSQFI